ncbi:hypothetical protein ACU4HD_12180 [Cupriavidus basilensis]
MEAINKTIYRADDGQIFETEKACVEHEAKITARAKLTTYWRVSHSPDLTEGRGFQALTLVECYGPEAWNAEMFMQDWCFRKLGRPVDFVQGVAPMPAWRVSAIDAAQFRTGAQSSIGSTRIDGNRLRLVLTGRPAALEPDPEQVSA